MGQQQLLLLVLGNVVVAIAVIAGMAAYTEGDAKADRDAAVVDAMRIATTVQAWSQQPSLMGGGGGSFEEASFEAIAITPTEVDGGYRTTSGCYYLTGGTSAWVDVYAPDCTSLIASVAIASATPEGITWDIETVDSGSASTRRGNRNGRGRGNGNGNGNGNR
ncbi:MAG TPA: hypothetical protein VD948_13220 [Rhodothermales bacterium]|nr:hypothetical protein [Rhodothermales bacterium]